MVSWSVFFRLMAPGARLHPLEAIPFYGCAVWFAVVESEVGDWGHEIAKLAITNAFLQAGLFLVVVQIPCWCTGIMSNVDLAWPSGLVSLAGLVLWHHFENYDGERSTDAWGYRSFLVGMALLLHGGRMAVGAMVLFFPYDWPNGDLPRYKYARARWIAETGAEHLWWLKQQQETLLQAYANSVLIAAPVILVATNPNHPGELRPMEMFGLGSWLVCSVLENISDAQKIHFQRKLRKAGTSDSAKEAVIGSPPYDGWNYCMWTKSRHPNYFFEWMCWNSLVLTAIPSALDLGNTVIETNHHHHTTSWIARFGIWVLLACLSRTFYDCLLYWTGAEPAESRSVKRRPLYKEYQKSTNVFFPVSVPFFDHHRTPRWPVEEEESKKDD